MKRREFLGGLSQLAAAALVGCGPAPAKAPVTKMPAKKKRILILGGTGFLGPKTIDVAVAHGHEVTIFNRGKREKLTPLGVKVEHLYGNRDPDLPADDEKGPDGKLLRPDGTPRGLEQLAGRTWDVVIDNSGYYPKHVAASAKLLAPSAQQYVFISSISAYDVNPPDGGDETAPLAKLADPNVDNMGPNYENYGGLKVLCEQAARAAFGDRTTIVRPGYIIGPGDPTDRFTYWPVRISQGGTMLAPGSPDDPLQWIDVRDLAEWLVTVAERGVTGSFNTVGPTARWGDVLATCVKAAGPGAAKLAWVRSAWLAAHGAGGEDAFPIWVAPTGKFAGFHRWKSTRAEAAGLTYRPLDVTVRELLAWWPGEVEHRAKIAAELVAAGKPAPKKDPRALRAGPEKPDGELLAKWTEPR